MTPTAFGTHWLSKLTSMHHIVPTLSTQNIVFRPLECDVAFAEKAITYLESFHQDVERHVLPALDVLQITSLGNAFATAHNVKRQLVDMVQDYRKLPQLLGYVYSPTLWPMSVRITAVVGRTVALFGVLPPQSKGYGKIQQRDIP